MSLGRKSPRWRARFAMGMICSSFATGVCAQEVTPAPDAEATASDEAYGTDIVVTARRTEERLQDVPVAITALSGDDLKARSIVSPIDLSFNAPSIQLTTNFGRLSGGFSIRGLSGGVQTYFAEIPGGPTEAGAPFYDISSVQVLNGPQGTLFGRANTAGAVLVTPAKPEFNRFNGAFEIQKGSLDLTKMSAMVNVPVIDDELAVRVAVNHFSRNGYTKVLGSDERLNEDNNWGVRISANWNPGGGAFTNYMLADWYTVDQKPGAFVLSAINPNLAIFNLPGSIDAPDGAATGAAVFGAVCQTAVSAGLASSINGCIDERLRKAATFKPALIAEYDRARSGGDAVRSVPQDPDLRLDEVLRRFTFVDHAELDFGKVGPTTLVLRNIFGYQAVTGATGWDVDGLGGLIQSSVSVSLTSAYPMTVSAQQAGRTAIYEPGPRQRTYSNETQLQGVVGDDALIWSTGYYFQSTPAVRNLKGIRNLSRVFSGITLPTQGYNPSFPFANGGNTRQEAVFGQASFDFGSLGDALSGFKLTGGLRKTWDRSRLVTAAVSTDLTTGAYVPGADRSAETSSAGWNYTLSLDWRITPDLMVYGAHRKGYRPGGINQTLDATSFPNYTPTYAPETVKDFEVGAKYSFRGGGMRGHLNLAAYDVDYSNIQRTFTGSANGVTTTYVGNASAARIRGLEAQFDLASGGFGLNANFAVSDPKFTSWVGSDPLGLIGPGNAACLPGSTASLCLIDLADTPFPNISKYQGSMTLRYSLPVGSAGSELTFSATGYYQSRRYFIDATQRNVDVYGEAVRDAISQPSFGRINLRTEWSDIGGSGVNAAAFVNNLTDKDYKLTTLTQLHSLGVSVSLYGEPRIFGLELSYRFGR